MKISALLLLAASLAFAAPSAAQAPERPNLPRGADANDWQAYVALGELKFWDAPDQAYAAFYWASRLDPSRPEPPLAMWAAFFARDAGLWLGYLNADPEVLRRPQVIANDSLATRAYLRNPFVHRGLEVALVLWLGDMLQWDERMYAFTAYGRGNFHEAAERFGALVRANPGRNVRLRHFRALSFAGAGQMDSAVVEVQTLLQVLRARDEARVGTGYESKARWEYALGRIYEAQGRTDEAREAFGRALMEDLAMYPANAALARLEVRSGNAAEALVHAATAAETAPGDAVMQFEHANALAAAGHLDQAVQAYRRAIELEPYWADPYLRLGVLNDTLGEAAEALAAYRGYVERAPRGQAETIRRAEQRIATLQQPG
jgi:tetratricopeptide (TPR) repeat protein